jgi:hypothetical protein
MSHKFYIGYLSGPAGILVPDVFTERPLYMDLYIGKPWGSYVSVAGPFETGNQALSAVSVSRDDCVTSYKRRVGK